MRIAITVGEAIIARNILTPSFVEEFFKSKDATSFTILTDQAILDQVRSIVGNRAEVVAFKRSKETNTERVLMSFARSGLDTHTNLWTKMRAYARGDIGLFSLYRKRLLTALFGRSSFFKQCIRYAIIRMTRDASADELLDSIQPDILICLSLTNFNFDVPLARSAKQKNIPIIGMVRSWDNFTSHGVLRVVPDRLIMQNSFLKEKAITVQNIPAKCISETLVGLPHYDAYLKWNLASMGKENFFEQVGFSPNEKMIFYGAMGEFLFKEEMSAIEVMNDLARDGKFGAGARILVRAHPKFKPDPEAISKLSHVLFDTDTNYVEGVTSTLSSEARLINSLVHADAIVTAASTIALDALVFGRRPICIGFDGYITPPHWLSVKRYYDSYSHFEALVETGAVAVAYTPEALIEEVTRSKEGVAVDLAALTRAKKMFLEPLDGHAGERAAKELKKNIAVYGNKSSN